MTDSFPSRPADFGELGLRHEVDVFVYRHAEGRPQYLLLMPEPRHEGAWRPVTGPVDWHEDLRRAALRRVRSETGLAHPADLVSPMPGLVEEVGDLRLVRWPVGFALPHPDLEPRPAAGLAAWRWTRFEEALDVLEEGVHRQLLLRLHAYLAA